MNPLARAPRAVADGALKGELATGWQASADARLWVFDLRKEVRFHDGTAFDAQSVVESIQLHLDAGPSSAGWHLVSNIDAVRASGPYPGAVYCSTAIRDHAVDLLRPPSAIGEPPIGASPRCERDGPRWARVR